MKTVQSIKFYLQDIRLKDMLTCTKDLTRLTNAHEECRIKARLTRLLGLKF
jgi:hypothetical protein